MSDDNFDGLKLENQLCFPLYACAKEVVHAYKPFLDKLDLTYTQYIAMMVLWERKSCSVKELGDILYLNSGTLTPLLKKLEAKGYIERNRSTSDERLLIVSLTQKGEELKTKAADVPVSVGSCIRLSKQEAESLYMLLYKVLHLLKTGEDEKAEI